MIRFSDGAVKVQSVFSAKERHLRLKGNLSLQCIHIRLRKIGGVASNQVIRLGYGCKQIAQLQRYLHLVQIRVFLHKRQRILADIRRCDGYAAQLRNGYTDASAARA
ncbi:hypothetical protein SDC9_175992 [bioreactor metagenome]|uniref:Uncharacterized protein n=1 Tax=bioreactor metagenome TaxID=1076179 RepID=A0A645GQP4_9ZZZZ